MYGPADADPEESKIESSAAEGPDTVNEFPEQEVDEVRAQKDAALLRYIQVDFVYVRVVSMPLFVVVGAANSDINIR